MILTLKFLYHSLRVLPLNSEVINYRCRKGCEYCFRPTALFSKLYAQFEFNYESSMLITKFMLESSFEQKMQTTPGYEASG